MASQIPHLSQSFAADCGSWSGPLFKMRTKCPPPSSRITLSMLSSVLERRLSTNPVFLYGQLTGTMWAFGLAYWKVSLSEPGMFWEGLLNFSEVISVAEAHRVEVKRIWRPLQFSAHKHCVCRTGSCLDRKSSLPWRHIRGCVFNERRKCKRTSKGTDGSRARKQGG